MNEWLRDQLARGFSDFAGTTLSGEIPIKEELLNELLARWLANAGKPGTTQPALSAADVARYVRSATVHAGPGVVTLRFELAVQGL